MRYLGMTKTEYNQKCGIRLRECREAKKLTQAQLAQIVGYCTQQISNIERGTRGIKSSVHDLARALDVPAEYLLCETDYKTVYDQFFTEYEDSITTNHLLVELLKHMGNSIYRLTSKNDNSIEYNEYDTPTFGEINEDKVILNGVTIERTVFQHMLDDILDQIKHIIKSPQKYSERRVLYLAVHMAREYEKEEKQSDAKMT